ARAPFHKAYVKQRKPTKLFKQNNLRHFSSYAPQGLCSLHKSFVSCPKSLKWSTSGPTSSQGLMGCPTTPHKPSRTMPGAGMEKADPLSPRDAPFQGASRSV